MYTANILIYLRNEFFLSIIVRFVIIVDLQIQRVLLYMYIWVT